MAAAGSLQLSHKLGLCNDHGCNKKFQSPVGNGQLHLLGKNVSSLALCQDSWSVCLSRRRYATVYSVPYRCNQFKCHSFLNPGQPFDISVVKNAASSLTRACSHLQGSPLILKLVPPIGILVFTLWGLGPLMRQSRNIFLHKSDSSWRKSSTHYIMTSYLQPLLLWTGATLICRALDPLMLPSEASQIVKQRLLNFVRSLSTVLAFAYCLSSIIQQAQKFFMETNDPTDARNMGFQFAGKALYSAVWVAAVSLFMELLGFSTQKWLTAGGLGTVLLTLAGREIFTNFLSSAMIHATRPFVVNEWIQTKIEGYEVSGTVEHVGWWSPTIVRGEDREAVHIPNHKFTVNVVRNLSQKTHWRVKTHLAISHLDVNKINIIVADMRKVLAKNPQVEQQKLHRRVFLDNINPENQALMILISCFVKTSHFEEYLCVKEAIMLDLLKVIRHHRARLATPIRTLQKIYSDSDLDGIPVADSVFTNGAASNRPLLLIEPPYKINGEDRTKNQNRPARTNGEHDGKAAVQPAPDNKADSKSTSSQVSNSKAKEMPPSDSKNKELATAKTKAEMPNSDARVGLETGATSISDLKKGDELMARSVSKTVSKPDSKYTKGSSADSKVMGLQPDDSTHSISNKQQSKKTGQGNSRQVSAVDNPPAPLPENGGEKQDGSASNSQPRQKDERLHATQPPLSKPALEENIVLGVALEGSKRTLPIEEEMASPATSAESKELTARHRGSEKDKRNGQTSSLPGSTPGD